MANKIISVLLALMLLCVMPIALADDANEEIEVDANITLADEREVKSILAPYGAEVRLLQLEKSITRNILIGDEVLKVLDNNSDANLTAAENTLNALEMLLEEVKSTTREGDKNALVQTYVELKKEARTLVAEFKKQTKDLLTGEYRTQIMSKIKEIDKNSFTKINETIKEKTKNFNAEKVKEHLKAMGLENEPIVERIRNGDANFKEAKEYALNKFKDLNVAEKKQIATKMRNDSIKKIVEGKEMVNKIKPTLEQKLMNNIQNRLEDLNAWIQRKGIDANTVGRIEREERIMEQIERVKQMVAKPNGNMDKNELDDQNKPIKGPMNGGGKQ